MTTAAFYVQLQARPGHGDAVLAVLNSLCDDTGHEPGARVYAVHRDPADPDRFSVYERYQDESAGRAHMESAAVQKALAAFGELLARPPQISPLQWMRGFERPR
jgi:autoinducer 2-degrading protein